MDRDVVLRVEDLRTEFSTDRGLVKAVDGVSFELRRGERLGVVGESGSGKSVTNLSILRLLPEPPGRVAGGRILFRGRDGIERDLASSPEEEIRALRGRDISMIFQDPLTSLNPVLKVGTQIAEAIELHRGLGRREARAKAVDMLRLIGIPDPARRAEEYPHQFSGGMRQRVMIAMALSCDPEVLIADEPTTALDVTIQAQILELVKELSSRGSTSVIMITHDLGVVAGLCDAVCVMYAGRIVERAPVDELFRDPRHPYTRGLLDSIPRADRAVAYEGGAAPRLYSIPGSPPSLVDMPEACAFAPRCPLAEERCRSARPPEIELEGMGGRRTVACWLRMKGGER